MRGRNRAGSSAFPAAPSRCPFPGSASGTVSRPPLEDLMVLRGHPPRPLLSLSKSRLRPALTDRPKRHSPPSSRIQRTARRRPAKCSDRPVHSRCSHCTSSCTSLGVRRSRLTSGTCDRPSPVDPVRVHSRPGFSMTPESTDGSWSLADGCHTVDHVPPAWFVHLGGLLRVQGSRILHPEAG